MKKFLITILLSALIFSARSQDTPSFISLQSGPSFPVGKYKAWELENPAGSFAITGISVSIEGAWFFKPYLGVGGQAGIHFHPVDVSTLGYRMVQRDEFLNDMYIRSDPFRNYTFYAGLYFDHALVQRLHVTAKALGGMIYSQTPYQLFKADYYLIGEDWYEITSAGDYEGSFMVGAGFKYSLKNCIGFTLNSEFTYNKADFEFLRTDGSIRTDIRTIAFVNVTAGVFIKM